jgi:hypothetical protein
MTTAPALHAQRRRDEDASHRIRARLGPVVQAGHLPPSKLSIEMGRHHAHGLGVTGRGGEWSGGVGAGAIREVEKKGSLKQHLPSRSTNTSEAANVQISSPRADLPSPQLFTPAHQTFTRLCFTLPHARGLTLLTDGKTPPTRSTKRPTASTQAPISRAPFVCLPSSHGRATTRPVRGAPRARARYVPIATTSRAGRAPPRPAREGRGARKVDPLGLVLLAYTHPRFSRGALAR